MIFELHAPGDFGKDRVVFAAAGVQPGRKPPAALADDDGAAGDDVAVVGFDAQPLRIGIAPVARTALSFFMSHNSAISVGAGDWWLVVPQRLALALASSPQPLASR